MSNTETTKNKKFTKMALSIAGVAFIAVISIILIVSQNLSGRDDDAEGEYDVCGIGA